MQDIAYPYIETRVADTPAISIDEIKSYLKLNSYNVAVDDELALMCQVALDYAQKYTRRLFVPYIVETKRCFWGELRNGDFKQMFMLRRGPVKEIVSITYDEDNELDAGLYKLAQNPNGYARVLLSNDVPTLETDWFPISIVFKAGYCALPSDVKLAMLQHIASMWMNRGDTDNDTYNKCPKISKDIYKKYKIMEVGV